MGTLLNRRRYMGGGGEPANPYGGWIEGMRYTNREFVESSDYIVYKFWVFPATVNLDLRFYCPNPNRDINGTIMYKLTSQDGDPSGTFSYNQQTSKPNNGSVDYSTIPLSINARIVNSPGDKKSYIGVSFPKQYWSGSGLWDYTNKAWIWKGKDCNITPE